MQPAHAGSESGAVEIFCTCGVLCAEACAADLASTANCTSRTPDLYAPHLTPMPYTLFVLCLLAWQS